MRTIHPVEPEKHRPVLPKNWSVGELKEDRGSDRWQSCPDCRDRVDTAIESCARPDLSGILLRYCNRKQIRFSERPLVRDRYIPETECGSRSADFAGY